MKLPRVGIIGAGAAGVTCAAILQSAGYTPVIFEKSRGVGGRLATRRLGSGEMFDHGAPYISGKSDIFSRFVERAISESHAAIWAPWWRGGDAREGELFVGIPTMNAILKHQLNGIETHFQTEVASISRSGEQWILQCVDDVAAQLDVIVCTAPAPQANRLVGSRADFATTLERVKMSPCWTVLARQAKRPQAPAFDAAAWPTSEIALVTNTSAKPGRSCALNCWTLHFGKDWSFSNLEAERNEIVQHGIAVLARILGLSAEDFDYTSAHRWRYARTEEAVQTPFLEDETQSLYCAGDWCLGPYVDNAFRSGLCVAEKIVHCHGRAPSTATSIS
ncbi:MAG: NAD(P)-binding protein [Marinicaulis sp.]|nr:FAD-dependent oxidoreductase [Marinicaulis sp.]NNE41549.1 NAD(P)-binding protein [Marinicaulis sp.]NNL88571.1 NAD(P)-binding protein [Marinicaulis sp.]